MDEMTQLIHQVVANNLENQVIHISVAEMDALAAMAREQRLKFSDLTHSEGVSPGPQCCSVTRQLVITPDRPLASDRRGKRRGVFIFETSIEEGHHRRCPRDDY